MLIYNVRSILDITRRQTLANSLALQDIDIVCLSETWLTSAISNNSLFLNQFNVFRGDRPSKSGDKTSHGGTLIALSKRLISKEIQLPNVANDDCACVQIDLDDTNILIASIYSAPANSPYKWSLQKFTDFLVNIDNLKNSNNIEHVIITGDINFEFTNWYVMESSDNFESEILDLLVYYNFEQMIHEDSSGNSLQVILTNSPEFVTLCKINLTMHKSFAIDDKPLSNHYPYSMTFEAYYDPTPHAKLNCYSYSKADFPSVNDYILSNPFTPYCYSNVDVLTEQWYTWLDEIHKQTIPKRTKHRSSLPAWIKPETSCVIRKVKSMESKQLRNFSYARSCKILNLLTTIKEMTSIDQLDYEENVFRSRRFDKIYRYIKEIKSPDRLPSVMHYRDKQVQTDTDKANLFNNWFASVYNIATQLLESDELVNTEPRIITSSIHFSVRDIVKILSNLNVNKSRGPDNIPNIFLKKCAESLAPSIYLLLRTAANKHKFPSAWKDATIVPLFKKGDKSCVEMYRPVALLCTISKVYERILYDAIYAHVKDDINSSQYGFSRNKSAVLQLLDYVDDIYRARENQDISYFATIYIDFEKAFDKICHNILLRKLWSAGIQGGLHDILRDYLSNRRQRVRVNSSLSDYKYATSGVPQGSLLGPLMFVIYINDVVKNLSVDSKLFADDLKLYSDDHQNLQLSLRHILEWCNSNRMSANISKCGYLLFKGKDQGPFLFGNSVFERKQCEKDLGVIICDNLNWSEHIKSRVSKAYTMFHMIRRNVSPRTSKGAKMNLYRGLLVPILTYGMQVSHANTNSLSALELFQARVTKWIDHEPDYKKRLHRLNLLPISLYIELHDILLLSRIVNDKYNYDWEPKVRFPPSDKRTRAAESELFVLPKLRLSSSRQNFWYRSIAIHQATKKDIDLLSPTIKEDLTKVFKEYFANSYNYHIKSTWKMTS